MFQTVKQLPHLLQQLALAHSDFKEQRPKISEGQVGQTLLCLHLMQSIISRA